MQRILTAAGIALFLAGDAAGERPDAFRILKRVVKARKDVRTIQAEVNIHVVTDDDVRRFSGEYFADQAGRVRINFSAPARQAVIINEQGFHWLFQREKLTIVFKQKDMQTSHSKMHGISGHFAARLEQRRRGQISYDRRIHKLPWLALHQIKIIPDKRSTYHDRGVMYVRVHPERNVVRSFLIVNRSGRVIYSQSYFRHRNGIPRHIRTLIRRDDGTVLINNSYYRKFRTNTRLPDGLFVPPADYRRRVIAIP